jgi:hypothetical protein
LRLDLESDIVACNREVLLASVHKNKNYHHSNGPMTFLVEESVEKFAR